MKKPGVGDTVKVADQSSEYRNKTGTVISGPTGQDYQVQLNNHNGTVRLRYTQLKILTEASSRTDDTPVVGNDPDGRPTVALTTPTRGDRRDTSGGGFNPVSPNHTLGDARLK